MRLRFWGKPVKPVASPVPYASLRALADDWRQVLPLACAYPGPDEMPGMQPSLIAALYPVKPEDVYMRLLDVLRHGGATIDMQARINMLTDLYNMLHLEILGGYWQVALPQESWRLAGLTGRLEGQPADRQTLAGVAQVLHALGLLVSTTVTWEGSLPVEAQIIEDHRGKRMVRRVEHVDREAQVLRGLTPYTSTVHALATFVQTAEAARHATVTT